MTMDEIEITDAQLEQLGLTQHQWDLLNEAEQEAVFMQLELPGQGDGDDDQDDPKKGDLGEDDDLQDPAEKKDEKPAEKKAEKPADEVPSDDPKDEKPADSAPKMTPEEERAQDLQLLAFDYAFVYKPVAEDVTKLQAEVDKIAVDKTALQKAVDDGDKTLAEAMTELADLTKKEVQLQSRIDRASSAADDVTKAQEQRWNQAQEAFMQRPKSKVYDTDSAAYAVLSSYVQQLSQKPEIMGRGMMFLLFEADRLTRQRLALDKPADEPKAAKSADKKPAQSKDKKPAPRLPKTDDVPTTLGAVPAADIHAEDEGNPFAAIDKLDGPEYEKALAKMPRAQRDSYLQGINR